MTLRPIRAIKEINRSLDQLEQAEFRAREEARLELVRSASNYSKRTKQVVDGTMNLSAVLMRAGEVNEAERLLATIQQDVKHEEQVLLESVHEVEVASATRRERMTRLKVAKMLATAMLGAAVMSFSVVGVAVARYFSDGSPTIGSGTGTYVLSGPAEVSPRQRQKIVLLSLGDWTLELSKGQYRRYQKLVDQQNPEELRAFLLRHLPPEAADHLAGLLAEVGLSPIAAEVDSEVEDAVEGTKTLVASAKAPSEPNAPSSGGSSDSSQKSDKKEKSPSNENEAAGSTGCKDDGDSNDAQHVDLGPLKDLQEGCPPIGDSAATAD